jgi:hypothetical protein
VCDACRHAGHVATNWDMLAITLFIKKYKRNISNEEKDKLEHNWLEHWRGALGNPSKTPRHIMRVYIDYLDISVGTLDDLIFWDCWPDDDTDDALVATLPSDNLV